MHASNTSIDYHIGIVCIIIMCGLLCLGLSMHAKRGIRYSVFNICIGFIHVFLDCNFVDLQNNASFLVYLLGMPL